LTSARSGFCHLEETTYCYVPSAGRQRRERLSAWFLVKLGVGEGAIADLFAAKLSEFSILSLQYLGMRLRVLK
jgi:hypothetical protein